MLIQLLISSFDYVMVFFQFFVTQYEVECSNKFMIFSLNLFRIENVQYSSIGYYIIKKWYLWLSAFNDHVGVQSLPSFSFQTFYKYVFSNNTEKLCLKWTIKTMRSAISVSPQPWHWTDFLLEENNWKSQKRSDWGKKHIWIDGEGRIRRIAWNTHRVCHYISNYSETRL